MRVLLDNMANWTGKFMREETEPTIDLSLFDYADFTPDTVNKGESAVKESSENKKKSDPEKKRKRRKKKALTGVSRKRREANARERRRIEEMNHAYVDLKKTLPLPNVDISKLEILRLAIKWIDHLETLLKNYDEQKDLLNIKQMETSRPEELSNIGVGEQGLTPAKHDCLYHQFPDLKNTLWEESIGLQDYVNICHRELSPLLKIAGLLDTVVDRSGSPLVHNYLQQLSENKV